VLVWRNSLDDSIRGGTERNRQERPQLHYECGALKSDEYGSPQSGDGFLLARRDTPGTHRPLVKPNPLICWRARQDSNL